MIEEVILIQGLNIKFFKRPSGRVPVIQYLDSLPRKVSAKMTGRLNAIKADGFVSAYSAGYIYKIKGYHNLFSVYLKFQHRQERILNFMVHKNTLMMLNGFTKTSPQRQRRAIKEAVRLKKMVKE